MTDNEIIKALECCLHYDTGGCKNCPLDCGSAMCIVNLMRGALDLIKRQQAEIEELKNRLNKLPKFSFNGEQLEKIKNDCLANVEYNIKEIKSEAVKEFEKNFNEALPFGMVSSTYVRKLIQETLKEMRETQCCTSP